MRTDENIISTISRTYVFIRYANIFQLFFSAFWPNDLSTHLSKTKYRKQKLCPYRDGLPELFFTTIPVLRMKKKKNID